MVALGMLIPLSLVSPHMPMWLLAHLLYKVDALDKVETTREETCMNGSDLDE